MTSRREICFGNMFVSENVPENVRAPVDSSLGKKKKTQ